MEPTSIAQTYAGLTAQITWVQSIPLTDTLSDSAVSSLMKIYAALHNLVVTCSLDDTYGDRKTYGAAIDRLYRICRRRCTKRYSFARRSRMTSVLYDSLYGTCRDSGSDKVESCCKYGTDIISTWFGRYATTTAAQGLKYDVLRNIAYGYYPVPEEDRNDKAFRYFAGRIAAWTAELDGHEEWVDVSEDEALQRVDILCRNSYMFLDGTHDRQIERLYNRYYARITGRLAAQADMTVDDCRTLALLYELAMYCMPCGEGYDKAAHIVQLAHEKMRTLPEDSDAQLICRAVCIDWLCMQQAQAIQERIFSNIA